MIRYARNCNTYMNGSAKENSPTHFRFTLGNSQRQYRQARHLITVYFAQSQELADVVDNAGTPHLGDVRFIFYLVSQNLGSDLVF